MIDSTHKENIKKTREAITPIADAKKLCVCQNIPSRDQNHPEVGQSGITNLGTLRDKNFFKIYSITSISCLSLDFVLFCFSGISR